MPSYRIFPIVLIVSLSLPAAAQHSSYFRIQAVDDATGRGVPLVELRTVNQVRYISDSAGLIAFNEPGLMEGEVFFHVRSPGYEVAADGFGYRGVTLRPRPGGNSEIRLKRLQAAERVCGLTGQGIYRDSVLLGEKPPLASAVPNAQVMGQDSAQAVLFEGRMLWFWGDTDKAAYPLGNFYTTGAVATLPGNNADLGIEYRYFTGSDGFTKPMIPSEKPLPIWVSGVTVLGKELYAYYAQVKALDSIDSSGYLKWDSTKTQFDIVQTFDKNCGWRRLDGHPVQFDGYVYGNSPPNVRVEADPQALLDATAYEAFTCLSADGSVRRVGGKPDYRWQRELPPITSEIELKLVREGKLQQDETRFLPLDASGAPAILVSGSVRWNAHRRRWVGIFGRKGGKDSFLGEIVYAEADTPTGPYRRAVKVADHPNYSFYNPVHHAFLDRDRFIYFEGTYTAEFSGNPDKTPFYNYNQLLYRLELDDPRLEPAKARSTEAERAEKSLNYYPQAPKPASN